MKKQNLKKVINICSQSLIFITLIFTTLCARKGDLEKGIDAIKKGEYSKAVKSLNIALNKDSLSPEAHYNLSLVYAFLDSAQKSFRHYLRLADLGSNLKDDNKIREMLAGFLNLESYTSSLIPMKRMNQFKGAFNPDGQMIAVAAAKSDIANIYLMQLDGSIVGKITKHGMNTDPDFSPAGEHIVFVSDKDGDEELYLYDLKSKEVEKLTDNTAQDFSPSFSPDSKEVVFISNMDDPYKWEIYKIVLSDKKIKRLTNNNYWDGFPRFSSDGKSIVFSSKRNGSEDIFIMNKNGGGEKVLYESSADDNDPTLLGEELYFKSNQDDKWEIYRFNIKNKSFVRLTNNSYPDWNPRISRDGSKILVARRMKKRWQLYFINLNSPISAELIVAEIKKKVK